jgi:hypothetical protein
LHLVGCFHKNMPSVTQLVLMVLCIWIWTYKCIKMHVLAYAQSQPCRSLRGVYYHTLNCTRKMVIAISLKFVAWWKLFGSLIWNTCLKIIFKNLLFRFCRHNHVDLCHYLREHCEHDEEVYIVSNPITALDRPWGFLPESWGSQISRRSALENGKRRPPLSPGNIPGTHFC